MELRYRAEFKLSVFTNLGARLFTGHWAPYAWCELVYRFHKTKKIEISVEGSSIPSQRLYIDWKLPAPAPAAGIVPEYNMLDASPPQVDGFVLTKNWGCKPAPDRGNQLLWQGQAT